MVLDEKSLQIENVEFWDDNGANKGGIRISWSSNIGFGYLDLVKDTDDSFFVVSDCMDDDSKKFTKMLFKKLIEKTEVVD